MMIVSDPDTNPNPTRQEITNPDPTCQVISDPDPDRLKLSDPSGSGSATLILSIMYS